VARAGEGKRGGYRVFIIFRSTKITYFAYAFAKSAKEAKDDLDENDEQDLKDRASDILSLDDQQIAARLEKGTLIEIL
jgi:hypothetical protein